VLAEQLRLIDRKTQTSVRGYRSLGRLPHSVHKALNLKANMANRPSRILFFV